TSTPEARSDWWVTAELEPPKNVTGNMKSVPGTLLPDRDRDSYLGVAEGKLWRIHADGTAPQSLSAGPGIQLSSIYWPINSADRTDAKSIVFATRDNDRRSLNTSGANTVASTQPRIISFDLASEKFTPLQAPTEG